MSGYALLSGLLVALSLGLLMLGYSSGSGIKRKGVIVNWSETFAKIILYGVIILLLELLFVGIMSGWFNKIFGW